jgi:ATP-binding cassette subfamily F protein 3
MISITDLTVAFGGTVLLNNISLHISEKDRIGLTGRNGAGKSTLLKLIVGEQHPTEGKVMVPQNLTIGYLPQVMQHHKGRTVMEETMTVFADFFALHRRVDEISAELATREDYDSKEYSKLIVELNTINDRLAMAESESPEVAAKKTLRGLGFRDTELGRATETFSQGWNMRIELAKILLRKPDVLLLDEPTNHLDIESIQWLEDYLQTFSGSMVLISHDRRFLDNTTNRTVEIMLGRIHDYKVPYSKYLVLREERIAQQKAAYENQQRTIEKTEEFIERFRYKPTKSNQVQSRIKALERMERIELEVEDKSALSVKFPPAPRSGDVAFKVTDASISYPDAPQKIILSGANIEIKRGEKVAFVGRNGEGKTTMMKTLMGALTPIKGSATVGYNVKIGYYAQNQEDVLDRNDTVYGTLDKIAVGDIRMKLRDILGAFLFRGEDIDKKVAVLSGGERARLSMARLMLEPYNLLALDEPTNHMDIRSKDILKQALMKYDGTMIVVSHDRDFLTGLVDKIYEFGDGRVREHLGGVDDFLRRKKIENFEALERKTPGQAGSDEPVKCDSGHTRPGDSCHTRPAGSPRSTASWGAHDRVSSSQQDREARREMARLKNRFSNLEKAIAEIEGKMAEIEKVLAAPGENDDIMDLTRAYLEQKRELDIKMEEWASLAEKLEQ